MRRAAGGGCGRAAALAAAGSRGPGPCARAARGCAGRRAASASHSAALPLGRLLPGGPQTSTHQRPESHAACRDRRRRKGVRAKPGGWHPSAGTRRRPAPSPSPSPAFLRLPSPGASPPPFLLVLLRRSLRCLHHRRPDPTFSPAYPTFAPARKPLAVSVCALGPRLSSPRPSVPNFAPFPRPPPPPRHPSRLLPQPPPAAASPFLLHQARFPRLRSP